MSFFSSRLLLRCFLLLPLSLHHPSLASLVFTPPLSLRSSQTSFNASLLLFSVLFLVFSRKNFGLFIHWASILGPVTYRAEAQMNMRFYINIDFLISQNRKFGRKICSMNLNNSLIWLTNFLLPTFMERKWLVFLHCRCFSFLRQAFWLPLPLYCCTPNHLSFLSKISYFDDNNKR